MKTKDRNAILKEDFVQIAKAKNDKCEYWKHKEVNVIAFLPKKEKLINEIIFLRCEPQDLKKAIPFGTKFTYNTDEELMTFVAGISKNQ